LTRLFASNDVARRGCPAGGTPLVDRLARQVPEVIGVAIWATALLVLYGADVVKIPRPFEARTGRPWQSFCTATRVMTQVPRDVGSARDIARQVGAPIVIDLGRHMNDHIR